MLERRMIWVAEIGSAHQGNKSLAYELIRKAKWAGATVAKFQFGWTREAQEKYAGGYDERRYVDDWAEDLARWCADLDIELMASIWSLEGLEVARSVGMKRYKIAHQIQDELLVKSILNDGKPVFWSSNSVVGTGEPTVTWVYSQDKYPAHETGFDIRFYDDDNIPAYSSHMHGIADALIAVARGANYIEKHLTLDKTLDFPRDASFSLLPEEFRTMVDIGNEMARLR